MSYTKTVWVNNTTPLNADNMNNIESGVETANTDIEEILDGTKIVKKAEQDSNGLDIATNYALKTDLPIVPAIVPKRSTASVIGVDAGGGVYTYTITSVLLENASIEVDVRAGDTATETFLEDHLLSNLPVHDSGAGTLTFECDSDNLGVAIELVFVVTAVEDVV